VVVLTLAGAPLTFVAEDVDPLRILQVHALSCLESSDSVAEDVDPLRILQEPKRSAWRRFRAVAEDVDPLRILQGLVLCY